MSLVSRAEMMWDSWLARHRRSWMATALEVVNPESVFEIGCGSGPNLRYIQRAADWIKLGGQDADPELVEWAREKLGLPIQCAKLQDSLPSNWDCILSCYTLAYVPPEELIPILQDLRSNKWLVLLEPCAGVRLAKQWDDGPLAGVHRHQWGNVLDQAGWQLIWAWPIIPDVDGMNMVVIARSLPDDALSLP